MGRTLSHGKYFWTHLLSVWHCAARCIGIHRRVSKAQCRGVTVQLGQHSCKKSSFSSVEVRQWGGMEKSERNFNVQVSNDRLHNCFYRKDCWFPSSLFYTLSSVSFQIIILQHLGFWKKHSTQRKAHLEHSITKEGSQAFWAVSCTVIYTQNIQNTFNFFS